MYDGVKMQRQNAKNLFCVRRDPWELTGVRRDALELIRARRDALELNQNWVTGARDNWVKSIIGSNRVFESHCGSREKTAEFVQYECLIITNLTLFGGLLGLVRLL